jgi:uncharacterized secreted protein with C-terminal beta-propeller domain
MIFKLEGCFMKQKQIGIIIGLAILMMLFSCKSTNENRSNQNKTITENSPSENKTKIENSSIENKTIIENPASEKELQVLELFGSAIEPVCSYFRQVVARLTGSRKS